MTNEIYDKQPSLMQEEAVAENKPGWEREVLERLAFEALREQRACRRWGIFFKLTMLSILIVAVWAAFDFSGAEEAVGSHTALNKNNNTIEAGGGSGSTDTVIPALDRAFSVG